MRCLLAMNLALALLTPPANAQEPTWRTAEVLTIRDSTPYPLPRDVQIVLQPVEGAPSETADAGRTAQILPWIEPPAESAQGRAVLAITWTEATPEEPASPVIRAQGGDEPSYLPPLQRLGHLESSTKTAEEEYYVFYETVGNNRFFAGADFLLWWLKEGSSPALLTTSLPVQPPSDGAFGRPGTAVLYDGNDLTANPFCGGRFFGGFWLNDQQSTGIEGRGFFLGERSADFIAGTAAFPVLARPFFNLNDFRQDVETIGFPGLSTGVFTLQSPSRLWGAEANIRQNLWCADCGWFDFLAGFRYLDLDEGLMTSEVVFVNRNPPPAFRHFAGDTRVGVDEINTENKFYGGQIGGVGEWRQGRLACQVRATVGFGETHETVAVSGAQLRITRTGEATVSPGNLLALPTNMGLTTRNQFAVVPEVGINFGWWLTDNVRVNLGYNFLYWSNVVRPGDQVDPVVDISQIPNFRSGVPFTGFARPTVVPNDTDIWAQGINAGLEFRW